MIVTFSVSNFRSFSEEVTFSLVASSRAGNDQKNHLVPIPNSDMSVLRAGVIYGANGSGKSNFCKALEYLRSLALDAQEKGSGTGREPFRFSKENCTDSCFDIQFISNDKLYRFGISVDDDKIIDEWLILIEGKREHVIYERSTDKNGNVTVDGKGLKSADKKLRALTHVGGIKEQSFLATIRATLEQNSFNDSIRDVIQWFDTGITLVTPDSKFKPIGHVLSEDSDFLTFSSDFLHASSTGIDRLNVIKREIKDDEISIYLRSDDFLDKFVKSLPEDSRGVVEIGPTQEISIDKKNGIKFSLINIESIHSHENGEDISMDLSEESDGTQRLLNLLPALHDMKQKNAVFVIDEVERSMHPLLIHKFMEYFLGGCCDGRSQMIVTTHESHLLDQELLRRDEVWFAEKDQRGASKMYSLSDFQPRRDLKIEKNYLEGRFGAIPFLAGIDSLRKRGDALNEL
ncbi:ATP-binding protein [Ruficoccus sp. ZRK36]|uniref:AAA family ATPase n=1 Tax=Ruficoccus sp. ZRK36 TaxID=2866311 RepID=UPI001C72EFD5|nr:ATP-binding protein [Ruficoccus sp. ZRK36]QYY35261.1 ATP-binding protein [Ruficoccus sp. ZRK36]